MVKHKWTIQNLIEAINTSSSRKEVFIKIGYGDDVKDRLIKVVVRTARELGLDTSHIKGWSKSSYTPQPKRTLAEVLVKDSPHIASPNHIKKRLLKEGILKNECSICSISTYNNMPLILQMDHINGDNRDHRLENLRLLCPNCHSQTDTYAGRNCKRLKKEAAKCECGKEMFYKALTCRECSYLTKKKREWPDDEQLLKMIQEEGLQWVSEKLNVQKSHIFKRFKVRGIDITPYKYT